GRHEHRFVIGIAVGWGRIHRRGRRGRAASSRGPGRLGRGRAAREQSNNRKVANELFIHRKEKRLLIHGGEGLVKQERFPSCRKIVTVWSSKKLLPTVAKT